MKMIQLLLKTNVDNLGIVGDVVRVKPGFARNYLLPRGMATTPTDGNIARLAGERARMAEHLARERAEREALLEKVADFEITLQRSANEQGVLFGGVSQHDIAEALRAEGFHVDDRMVRVGEQIKRLDSYEIPIALDSDLKTQIKLWVVSDRPPEDLSEDEDQDSDAGASEGDEAEAEAAGQER